MSFLTTKKLYQFQDFLVHSPNLKGSYNIHIKDNQESSNIRDGNLDSNFFGSRFSEYNYKASLEINNNYGTTELDYILRQLYSNENVDFISNLIKLKKVFWLSTTKKQSEINKPKVFFNYGYANNTTITNDENDDSEIKISFDIKTIKPFFFECDRNLSIIDWSLLGNQQIYGYDNNAFYDSTQVYDAIFQASVNPNDPNISKATLDKYFGNCCGTKYNFVYKDIFNLANLSKREVIQSIAQNVDSKTLIIPLNVSKSIITSTDRSKVVLGSPFPTGLTGGKLDLQTSRKSEVMILELDANVPQNYWIKIKNLQNNSYIKFTWLSQINNGIVNYIQILPHLGKVYYNLNTLANPITDYTIEVSDANGSLYFDAMFAPRDVYMPYFTDSQNLVIEQSQTISNSLYIQTLKTFY